ncbi:hypothetical protein [Sinorhizobium meliloti]|uniref:hypothetical protein n=1 Tax=Rhizobium meliloti TaxID=382 RepID=UPI00299DDB00|nr:hypothetical protein [Sinorhizobium meliloti]
MTNLSSTASEALEADQTKTRAFSDGLEDVLARSANHNDVGDEGEEAEFEGGYERTVIILFPQDAGDVHDISSLTVSVCDILTWFAAHNEAERERIIQLRDDFYGGDSEFDRGYEIEPSRVLLTAEQRAEARVSRAETRARRAAMRVKWKIDDHEAHIREIAVWVPFLEEKASLEAEREMHWDRADALDAEWDAFVIKWKSCKHPDEKAKAAEHAALEAKGEALIRDQEDWEERWSELQDKAWQEFAPSRAETPGLGAGAHH